MASTSMMAMRRQAQIWLLVMSFIFCATADLLAVAHLGNDYLGLAQALSKGDFPLLSFSLAFYFMGDCLVLLTGIGFVTLAALGTRFMRISLSVVSFLEAGF